MKICASIRCASSLSDLRFSRRATSGYYCILFLSEKTKNSIISMSVALSPTGC